MIVAEGNWHHLKHMKTGEEQIVATLDGISLAQWLCTKLPRAPHEHEDVVGGVLVRNRGREAMSVACKKYACMTIAEIAGDIDARLAAIESRLAAIGG